MDIVEAFNQVVDGVSSSDDALGDVLYSTGYSKREEGESSEMKE